MANQVEIQITADPKNAQAGFKSTQTAFGKMADGIKRHRKAIGVGLSAVGAGITALGVSAVKSAQEEAIGIAQLDVALKNVGTSYDAQAASIEKVIAAQQNKTNFGDEAQRDALMGLVSVSGDYESAMAALPAVLDLAAGKGMDLGAASTLVARAIGGETSALKRYGIEVEKGAGATEVIAAIMAKFGGQAEAAADPMVQLKNRVGDLQQEFGKALMPALTSMAVLLEKVTTKLIAFSTEHPQLTKVLMIVVAALGAVALVVGPLLLLLPTMAASIGILSGAFGMLSLSMLPVTLAVVGIAAAITAGILIWRNWDTIVNALQVSFAKVFNFISEIVSKVVGKITDLYNSKLGWLLPAGPLVKGILFLKKNWGEIFAFIQDTIQKVFTKITDLYNSKLGWLLPAGPLIKAILFLKDNWDETWDGIKSTFTTVTDSLIGTFENLKSRVMGIWSGLLDFLKGQAIMPVIKGLMNDMIREINKWIEKINELLRKFKLPGKIPTIPTLAAGGLITQSGSAIVGERGPELLSLPRGASVAPLKSGGAGMTINLVINGDILGMEDFEQKVTSVIRDAVLGGGFSGVLARA
jgi:hypothetical protein